MPETSCENHRPTAGQLKHDLSNPVSQLLGFSELLLEDLQGVDAAGTLDKVNEAHKIARELHASIEAHFSAPARQNHDLVSEGLVSQLKACVEPAVEQIFALGLQHCDFLNHEPHQEDVRRILDAAAALCPILESALACIREGLPFKVGAK